MPPREPNGRSSLCRSSCTTCSGISNVASAGTRRRQAGREPRHLARDRQIALEMRGRNRQRRRRNCRSCRRRFRRRAAATSRRRRARTDRGSRCCTRCDSGDGRRSMRPGFGCAAHARSISRFEPAGQRVVGRRVGPRPPGRRHRAGAQLRDDAFPHLGIGARVLDVERVERQPGGLQPLVVAGDAVPVEHRARRVGLRRRQSTLTLWPGDEPRVVRRSRRPSPAQQSRQTPPHGAEERHWRPSEEDATRLRAACQDRSRTTINAELAEPAELLLFRVCRSIGACFPAPAHLRT